MKRRLIWRWQFIKTLDSIFDINLIEHGSNNFINCFTISITVCVNNCTNRVDGYYQSCYTCYGYVICSNGLLYNINCSVFSENKPLLWDNIKSRCEISSSTCDPDYLSSLNWKTTCIAKNLCISFCQKMYLFIVFIQ